MRAVVGMDVQEQKRNVPRIITKTRAGVRAKQGALGLDAVEVQNLVLIISPIKQDVITRTIVFGRHVQEVLIVWVSELIRPYVVQLGALGRALQIIIVIKPPLLTHVIRGMALNLHVHLFLAALGLDALEVLSLAMIMIHLIVVVQDTVDALGPGVQEMHTIVMIIIILIKQVVKARTIVCGEADAKAVLLLHAIALMITPNQTEY